MSESTMSMFANSSEYWKARCENAEDQNAALKEENVRLKAEATEWKDMSYKCTQVVDALKARVAELENALDRSQDTRDSER